MIRSAVLVLLCIFLFSCTQVETVQFGDQVWMSENLSSEKFRNGERIPEAKTKSEWERFCREGKPAWCYPMNNKDNHEKYGKLYNWYAVSDPRGIAPAGFHVASDEEWKALTDFFGGEIFAALQLRVASQPRAADDGKYGFSGLPAGVCKGDGSFFGFGSKGYWWTSTEANDKYAWIRQLDYTQSAINSLTFDKQSGLSVRCIKD